MKSFKLYLKEWKKEYGDFEISQQEHDNLAPHYNYNPDSKHIKKSGASLASLVGYVRSSTGLNRYHWHRYHNPDVEVNHEWENKTKHIDKLMDTHSTPHSLTVYSGTKIDPREHMDQDKIVHHPAFLSTSLSSNIAGRFAGRNARLEQPNIQHEHMLKIHVPEGHSGIYVGSDTFPYQDSDFHENAKEEKEFILPRGIKLRHIKTEESEDPSFHGSNHYKYYLHHMEIVK